MAGKTGIAWTDATWNPIRGCSRVSEGCRNCYAERVAGRFGRQGQPYHGLVKRFEDLATNTIEPRWTGEVRFVEEALTLPLHWKKPRRIFVNSMSDLFHGRVKDDWINVIFAVMWARGRHCFQVLTKRPERMRDYCAGVLRHDDRAGFFMEALERHGLGARVADPLSQSQNEPIPNVWLGVSVEDQPTADARIPLLLQTPAAVRFVSYEPALGPVDFDSEHKDGLYALGCGHEGGWRECKAEFGGDEGCNGIDWLIIGGESGPRARPFDLAWARSAVAQCRAAGVPVFVKQDSGPRAGQQGRIPDDLWIKECPP